MNRINWTQVAVFAVVVVLVFAVGIGVVSILWGGGYGMMGGYRGYDPSGMMGGFGGQFPNQSDGYHFQAPGSAGARQTMFEIGH